MYNYVDNLNKVCKFYERRNIYKIKGVFGRALWSIGFSSNDLEKFFEIDLNQAVNTHHYCEVLNEL